MCHVTQQNDEQNQKETAPKSATQTGQWIFWRASNATHHITLQVSLCWANIMDIIWIDLCSSRSMSNNHLPHMLFWKVRTKASQPRSKSLLPPNYTPSFLLSFEVCPSRSPHVLHCTEWHNFFSSPLKPFGGGGGGGGCSISRKLLPRRLGAA